MGPSLILIIPLIYSTLIPCIGKSYGSPLCVGIESQRIIELDTIVKYEPDDDLRRCVVCTCVSGLIKCHYKSKCEKHYEQALGEEIADFESNSARTLVTASPANTASEMNQIPLWDQTLIVINAIASLLLAATGIGIVMKFLCKSCQEESD